MKKQKWNNFGLRLTVKDTLLNKTNRKRPVRNILEYPIHNIYDSSSYQLDSKDHGFIIVVRGESIFGDSKELVRFIAVEELFLVGALDATIELECFESRLKDRFSPMLWSESIRFEYYETKRNKAFKFLRSYLGTRSGNWSKISY